jgi:tight adherence protein B
MPGVLPVLNARAVELALRAAIALGCELHPVSIFARKHSEEFAYAHSQLELGHTPIGVMNRMVRRVPLPEFRVFATAVVVHRRAGGNLSLLTERMSKAAHDRTDTRNHMLAVTAGSRLSAIGMVLAGIIALILLGWMQPEYIQTFVEHPRGPWLRATSILLQVIGAIWVWRILKPLS